MPKSSEKVSPPTKATKSQKNTDNTLEKVSKKLENIAKTNTEKNKEDVAEPNVQETPRRSLRTPRKSKNSDVDDNIAAKKRRR